MRDYILLEKAAIFHEESPHYKWFQECHRMLGDLLQIYKSRLHYRAKDHRLAVISSLVLIYKRIAEVRRVQGRKKLLLDADTAL